MPTDIEALKARLREAAEKATPGPWVQQEQENDGAIFIIGDNLGGLVGAALPWPIEAEVGGSERIRANASLIHLASPDTILALLTALDQQSARIQELERALRKIAKESRKGRPDPDRIFDLATAALNGGDGNG